MYTHTKRYRAIFIDENLNDNIVDQITEKDIIVKKTSSLIRLLNIKHGKELHIKFTEQQQLKANFNDKIQLIYYKSPLAEVLMNNKIGDIVEVVHSGELYKILEIED